MKYTVVVPIHNEASHINTLIPEMTDEVAHHAGGPQEILLVENGSSDETFSEATQMTAVLNAAGWNAQVISIAGANYGAAMREGFRHSTGDWVINFDIDYFSGPFVRDLETAEADVVIASKRAEGSDDQRSTIRKMATFVFNVILRRLLGSSLTDTHGIKAFRREALLTVEPLTVSTHDLFDTELVLRAERMGFAISEVPIEVRERREASNSLLKRIPRTLRGVFRLRLMFANEAVGSKTAEQPQS